MLQNHPLYMLQSATTVKGVSKENEQLATDPIKSAKLFIHLVIRPN